MQSAWLLWYKIMSSFEQPPLDIPRQRDINYEQLRAEALKQSRQYAHEADFQDRESVGGWLLADTDTYGGLGVGLQDRSDGGRTLALHIPHTNDLAPVGSPIDLLMRYTTYYESPLQQQVVPRIWQRNFNPAAPTWPTLSLEIPIAIASDGSLQVTTPTAEQTKFDTRQVASEQLDEEPRFSAHLDLARQLAAQRRQDGAFEFFHEGKAWVYDQTIGSFAPLSTADFVKREFLIAASMSMGNLLLRNGYPGIYVGQNQKPRFSTVDIAATSTVFFDGRLPTEAAGRLFANARGIDVPSVSPIKNYDALASAYAPVGDGKLNYAELVNTRVLEAVSTSEAIPYGSNDVRDYVAITADKAPGSSKHRPFPHDEYLDVKSVVDTERDRARDAYWPQRAPADYAHNPKLLRKAYEAVLRGALSPERLLESFQLRLQVEGSIPLSAAIDTIFIPETLPPTMLEVLREPMLLYLAANPDTTNTILQNAEIRGLLTSPSVRTHGDQYVASFLYKEQLVFGFGETQNEAKIAAVLALATGDTSAVRRYQQHPDAATWTSPRNETQETRDNPVHQLNLLSKPQHVAKPQVTYEVVDRSPTLITVRVVATIGDRTYTQTGVGPRLEDAKFVAASLAVEQHRSEII